MAYGGFMVTMPRYFQFFNFRERQWDNFQLCTASSPIAHANVRPARSNSCPIT